MYLDDVEKNSSVKFYRKRDDGAVEIVELSRGMFSDQDAYMAAIDFKYEDGFYDSYTDAVESSPFDGGLSI